MEQKIQEFLSLLLSKNTQRNYGYVLEKFNKWSNGSMFVDPEWTNAYMNLLKSEGLGNKTINLHMITIGRFYEYVFHERLRFKRLKEAAAQVTFLTDDQIQKILTDCGERFRPVFLFMLDTGIRVAELEWISKQEITRDIPNEFIILGKGGKQRLIVISNKTQEMLKKYLRSGLLFGETWSVRKVQYHLKRIGQRVGIGNIHPHQTRHTFAMQMIWAGIDIMEVKEMLGHSNLSTTAMYMHVTKERLRKVWGEKLNRE